MGKSLALATAALAALVAFGCKGEQVPVPVAADSPPAFAKGASMADFIAGKWCPNGGVDSETAEKFGVDPNSEIDVSQHWVFKPDGTFEYGKLGYDSKITGKWTADQGQVYLMYEMWDNETIQARKERLAKDEEGGGQAALYAMQGFDNTMSMLSKLEYLMVTEDGKGLTFSRPTPTDPNAMGGGIDISALMGPSFDLVRMK
jgi:hypothetical protein